ncbi:hypothetical protein [Oceanobacillus bengalensis]|uniref:Uncharacterized protein n=1 Tax=Oceanobacillus bengalensis TaxID=1435466 RepID=A0A494Z249_9BACI|nr:hypothetical protein [Oceanobacillus bengalensis]RKQ16380.1 hypothetical protein D8M05_07825 [Oceanobacillus bengalensis]
MRKLFILVMFVTLIAGCSDNTEPVIQKVENIGNKGDNSKPELIEEEVEDEQEIIEYIDFSVDDQLVRVNLDGIPILNNYLIGIIDKETAVEGMNLEEIEGQSIYLLEFSCQNDLCSYLIINQNEEDQSYLLTDLARYETTHFSPDGSKLAIQFSRPSSHDYPLHHIITINTETWELLDLQNETESESILQYTWPYISVEWIDDTSISVTKQSLIGNDEGEKNPTLENQNNTTTSILTIK